MKKIYGLALLSLFFLLAACGQKQESSGQIKIRTKEETSSASSSSEPEVQDLNYEELLSGNFSSLAGKWQNGNGYILSIEKDGQFRYSKAGADEKRGVLSTDHNRTQGSGIMLTSNPLNGPQTGFEPAFFLAKAGDSLGKGLDGQEDRSDVSKSRFVIGTQVVFGDPALFYYRVEE